MKAMTREEHFQEILARRFGRGMQTAEFRLILIEEGFFEDDPGLKRAREMYMDRTVRQLFRQRGWVNAEGEPIEVANVKRVNKETGETTQLYIVFDDESELQDVGYLQTDRATKSGYYRKEAERFHAHGVRVYGRKFQKLFPLHFP